MFDSLCSAMWWCHKGELGRTLLWLSPVLWLAAIIITRSLLLVLTVELLSARWGLPSFLKCPIVLLPLGHGRGVCAGWGHERHGVQAL